MKVAITGATGLIGSYLSSQLEQDGHVTLGVSRRGGESSETVRWDPRKCEIEREKLNGVEGVIHLAGENIAGGRWTKAQRERIRDSRVEGTRFLSEVIAGLTPTPKVFVCASAIGIYGSRGDAVLDETSGPGEGFLAKVCLEWEAASRSAEDRGIRTVHVRIAVVLSPEGGALAKMLPPFKLGLGGRMGDGKQYFSWIGIPDAVAGIQHCLMNETLSGPVNLVSPHPVTNLEFTKTLGRVLNRPTIFPVPSFVIEGVLGKMAARGLLLSSARVVPKRLEESGFTFRHPNLEQALRALLDRH